MTEEVRIVDPKTGGEKGSKLARYDLIPPHVLHALAEHYGRGARKYADRNWERGYRWGLSFAALLRHLFAWWGGEDVDEETGSSHMVAVAWHAFALAEFQRTGKGTDDRPVPLEAFRRGAPDGEIGKTPAGASVSLDTGADTGRVTP